MRGPEDLKFIEVFLNRGDKERYELFRKVACEAASGDVNSAHAITLIRNAFEAGRDFEDKHFDFQKNHLPSYVSGEPSLIAHAKEMVPVINCDHLGLLLMQCQCGYKIGLDRDYYATNQDMKVKCPGCGYAIYPNKLFDVSLTYAFDYEIVHERPQGTVVLRHGKRSQPKIRYEVEYFAKQVFGDECAMHVSPDYTGDQEKTTVFDEYAAGDDGTSIYAIKK